MPAPSTPRGRDRRGRIVAAAAALMYERGVHATSLEDVLAASGTGKSQLYHYFSGKEELVAEVLWHQLDAVLEEQGLFRRDTWEGLRAWFDALVGMHETRLGFRGCPLGSIASEVLDGGERVRGRAAEAFARWESALAAALRAMLGRGLLRGDADPEILAEATLAILQGGYLLASAKRDARPMRSAIAAALGHLESFAPSRAGEGPATGRGGP